MSGGPKRFPGRYAVAAVLGLAAVILALGIVLAVRLPAPTERWQTNPSATTGR